VPFERPSDALGRPEKSGDLSLRLNPDQQVVASTPRSIAWGDRGSPDNRYRPISGAALAAGDRFAPLYSLRDSAGRDYGAAAALIEHGCQQFPGARALYLWSGLVDSDHMSAQQLLAESLRYAVLHCRWPETPPQVAGFWEDFEGDLAPGSPRSAWQIVTGAKALLRDGALLLGGNTEILSRQADFSDFELSLDVRKEGNRYVEVFFRSRDISNGYMFSLRADGAEAALFRRQAGQWTQLGSRFFPHVPQTWYHLTIRAVGPALECSVDGQGLIKVEDPTYQTGAIGLGGWENDVLWDDVLVERRP
jgi:hypothetical protein